MSKERKGEGFFAKVIREEMGEGKEEREEGPRGRKWMLEIIRRRRGRRAIGGLAARSVRQIGFLGCCCSRCCCCCF